MSRRGILIINVKGRRGGGVYFVGRTVSNGSGKFPIKMHDFIIVLKLTNNQGPDFDDLPIS